MSNIITKIFTAPFRGIYRFFLWSSGADLSILDQVPTEKSKYFGIGGTIVFTALMATFAGGYAFYTAFKSELLSVFFGLFWGALIFNLDRYVVSTFGVGDGKKTISRQELVEAAPRLVMAILLGFVISTPLELKIFEREIQTTVQRLQIQEKEAYIAADSSFNNNLAKSKEEQIRIGYEIDTLANSKKELLANEQVFFDKLLIDLKVDLRRAQENLTAAQRKVNKTYLDYNFARKDTTDRFSTFQIARFEQLYRNASQPMAELKAKVKEINDEIASVKAGGGDAVKRKDAQLEERIAQLTARLTILNAQVIDGESSRIRRDSLASQRQASYNGFAAHLEAMSELTDNKPAVWWAKWLITILFIFIECAPILFKMMTERGPYDDILDRIKHETKVAQLRIQSDLNQRTNDAIHASAKESAEELEAKLKANRELMEIVATAQLEIAQVAIEEWKKEQIQKVRNNPGSVVSSSPGNPNGTT